MIDALELRLLRRDDLPGYKRLRDAALRDEPSAFTSDAPSESRKPPGAYLPRLGLDDPRRATFTVGAWKAGELVGAVSCECDGRVKVSHIGHVLGMMVRSDLQGHGIGLALLEACIAQARRCTGLEMLTLTVTAENAAAVRLYTRIGFTRYGSLPNAIKVDGRAYTKDQMVMAL